jgi:hypothetical protein
MLPREANVIKVFVTVNNFHFTSLPSFCVIKQSYYGNYCRMAVKSVTTFAYGIKPKVPIIYRSISTL